MDLSYYPEEGGWKRYAEGLIPIIILILIAIVLVGKTTNVFCTIPGFNAVLCSGGGMINIAVIGSLNKVDTTVDAKNLKELLDSDLGKACNMQYMEFEPDDLTYAKDKLLKNYDLIVLSGERNYTRPVREAVESYLESGGKMILIGDAATKDPEDPLYNGWGHIQVPIKLRTTGTDIPTVSLTSPMLKVIDINHPIVVGYGFKMNLSKLETMTGCGAGSPLEVVDVNPISGSTIMMISGTSEGKPKSIPAVVEESSLLGGKIYYFTFDPGCLKNMWVSTVQEITGKQTCVVS
ncbi:MAG: hypothetical protein QXO69_01810 [archaeon]